MTRAALALILAFMVPPPPVVSTTGPVATPSPADTGLRNIATVKSSPFCTSLVEHFNGALRPMVANDYALDRIDTQLTSLKDAFKSIDYAQQFTTLRVRLVQLVGDMQKRLPGLQDEVDRLRDGEALTKDPDEAKRLHGLAEKMQLAYNKQHQLTNDLLSVVQGMMAYRILDGDHPINGQDAETMAMPDEMKDIKSYLKFDGQRDVIRSAESDAADVAYDIASTKCR